VIEAHLGDVNLIFTETDLSQLWIHPWQNCFVAPENLQTSSYNFSKVIFTSHM